MTTPVLVLLVTDDRGLSTLATTPVSGLRVEVWPAEEVLEEPPGEEPGLVLLDVEQAEDYSSFHLARALATKQPNVPVVGLVEQGEMDDALALVRLGAKDVLVKPVRPIELRRTIQRFVGGPL